MLHETLPQGWAFGGACFSSKVSHKFPPGCGGVCLSFTLHPFLITKWPGTIYAPQCFSSCSPTDFCLGLVHFLPVSLLGYGWLQLSTNNHSRGIWLHSFCLGWRNKIVIWKCSFFFFLNVCSIVCLIVFCWVLFT